MVPNGYTQPKQLSSEFCSSLINLTRSECITNPFINLTFPVRCASPNCDISIPNHVSSTSNLGICYRTFGMFSFNCVNRYTDLTCLNPVGPHYNVCLLGPILNLIIANINDSRRLFAIRIWH